jgi:uncharacterized protein
MADYKTPGVYVEEISTLPPSVGQVPTAVPAFIGYTARASKSRKDLTLVPTHIASLLEYRELFGAEAKPGEITVTLDKDNIVEKVAIQTVRYLYDSVRLFYANGGGECYIVSVGDYSEAPSMDKLMQGLDALRAEDHPTMLVMPDAMLLASNGDAYALQQAMLKQCADMQNRFSILDVHQGYLSRNDVEGDAVLKFRNGIGINFLNYGAAYYPWIQSVYTPSFGFNDVKLVDADKKVLALENLVTNPQPVKGLIKVIADERNVRGASADYFAAQIDPAAFAALKSETDQDAADAAALAKEKDPLKAEELKKKQEAAKADRFAAWMNSQAGAVERRYGAFDKKDEGTVKELQHYSDTIKSLMQWLVSLNAGNLRANPSDAKTFSLSSQDMQREFKSKTAKGTPLSTQARSLMALNLAISTTPYAVTEEPFKSLVDTAPAALEGIVTSSPALIAARDKALATGATQTDKDAYAVELNKAVNLDSARPKFLKVRDEVVAILASVQVDAAKILASQDKALYDNEPLYKSIVNEIQTVGGMLPPSGGVAGLYAQVDNFAGVWKAPANVSLASTNRPWIKIDDQQQQDLNVDVNAGKSVNAIRSFQGKGTLVWGARTLAGNDNEWRYVSVRRTFIMIEQSIKASTFWAVFEANDSRTWVKVKAMIANYLTNLWRQGALAGSTPEAAFFVNIGLGQTMTAVDILEGRMNVEIGLAVVRPAEFIILKFSHKMQEV